MSKQFYEIIGGYVFHSPESAKQAQKELDGIRYIKNQLDMGNAEAVLQVYNQILEERLFKTIVGYSFLWELQEYLYCSSEIADSDVRPLDMQVVIQAEVSNNNEAVARRLKDRLTKSIIFNVILGILVVAMMVLMHFSDAPTIINYENKIIDKYELWEQELEQREEAVEELEEKLNNQP